MYYNTIAHFIRIFHTKGMFWLQNIVEKRYCSVFSQSSMLNDIDSPPINDIYVRFWLSSKSNFLCNLSIESLQGHYFQDKRRNKLNWSMWSVIYTAITKKKPDITFFKGQFRIAQQCNSNGISLVYSDKCAQSIIMTGLDWLI